MSITKWPITEQQEMTTALWLLGSVNPHLGGLQFLGQLLQWICVTWIMLIRTSLPFDSCGLGAICEAGLHKEYYLEDIYLLTASPRGAMTHLP